MPTLSLQTWDRDRHGGVTVGSEIGRTVEIYTQIVCNGRATEMSFRTAPRTNSKPPNRLDHVLNIGGLLQIGTQQELKRADEMQEKALSRMKDAETIGIQGFPKLGIPGLEESYDKLDHTCCHLAMDKPTRLPGDYVLASSNLKAGPLEVISAPLLKVPNPNEPYKPRLSEWNLKESVPAAAEYLRRVQEANPGLSIYSDHVQVMREIMGTRVYSTNASFVVMDVATGKLKKEDTTKGFWGTEKYFVLGMIANGQMDDFFQNFMDDKRPSVVGVQEATLEYFKYFMGKPANSGRKTCFFTQSGPEGSAIVVEDRLVSKKWLDGENCWYEPAQDGVRVGHLSVEGPSLWSVCGKAGRTFSAAVLTLNGQDVLMLNMHSPNPASDVILKSDPPFEKMNGLEYQKKAFTRQQEWLDMLLNANPSGSDGHALVVKKIQAEYNRCEKRLILTGDFNDASRVYIK